MNDYEKKLLANIDKHGWQLTFVFDPDGKDPNFGYSVGFEKTLGCPEFIVFGLPQELIHSILWDVFRKIKAGKIPSDGEQWNDLLQGDYICISRLVDEECQISEYFGSATWHHKYNGGDVSKQKFYQLVWPSTAGKYPWDENCPADFAAAQPSLYRSIRLGGVV